MKDSYGMLPEHKVSEARSILLRLVHPSRDFYHETHPKKFHADDMAPYIFEIKTPLARIWYRRIDIGLGHTRHEVGNYRTTGWSYLENRDELVCTDVFEDDEVARLDDFSRGIEREWEAFPKPEGAG